MHGLRTQWTTRMSGGLPDWSRPLRNLSPFIAIGVLSLVVLDTLRPVEHADRYQHLGLAALATLGLVALGAVLPTQWQVIVPVGFVVLLAVMHQHYGVRDDAVLPLLLLPVLWAAVNLRRIDAVITLASVVVIMLAPDPILDRPFQPATDGRAVIVLSFVGAMLVAITWSARRDITQDPLTGLGNRRMWNEAIRLAMARSSRRHEPMSVAVIDLDNLKRFNDTQGHVACDRFIADCASAWKRAVRPEDVLTRVGGDEFFLLLPTVGDEESASTVLNRVRAAVPQEQSCSIGVATWDGAEDVDQLMRRADQALYAAKHHGRSRIAVAFDGDGAAPHVLDL